MKSNPNFDYYAILDISRNASADEIKRAFRTRAFKYHPDKTTVAVQKAYYTRLFQNINEAYNCLSNSDARRQYDQLFTYPPGQLPNDPNTPTPLFLDLLKELPHKTKEDILAFEQQMNSMSLDTKIGKDEYIFLQILLDLCKQVNKIEFDRSHYITYIKKIDKNWIKPMLDVFAELEAADPPFKETLQQLAQDFYSMCSKVQNPRNNFNVLLHPPQGSYYWEDGNSPNTTSKTEQRSTHSTTSPGTNTETDTSSSCGCLVAMFFFGIVILTFIVTNL